MFKLSKNVYVIATVMAFSFTVVSMMVLITGLLGAAIAPNPKLGTLPAAMLIVGTASGTIPAAMWMQKVGRKSGMATGICLAILGTLLACYASIQSNFWLLVGAMVLIGFNASFTQQGRFIILENTNNEIEQADGLTLALMANLFAAILGPWLGAWGKNLIITPGGFAASFLIAASVLLIGLLCLSQYTNHTMRNTGTEGASRPIISIVKQPSFLIAMGSAAIGYGVMSLIMTATPLSMHHVNEHSLDHTRLVIQSHIVAMFLPSLLTGYLVKKGLRLSLLLIGLLLYGFVVIIGLQGINVMHYWWALVLLGLGWNLLFLTSTAMLPRTYQASEQFKAQAVNDFFVFSVQAIAAFAAGWLLFNLGWSSVLWISLIASAVWVWSIILLNAKKPLP